MKNLKRRDFLKMMGLAVVVPVALAKDDSTIEELKSTRREYCQDAMNNLEVELKSPPYLYDTETGKSRKLNLANPADAAVYVVISSTPGGGNFVSVDWKNFYEWSKYCDKAGLRYDGPVRETTILDELTKMAQQGNAFMYWDGQDEGKLKVVYGLPEHLASQIKFLSVRIKNNAYPLEKYDS